MKRPAVLVIGSGSQSLVERLVDEVAAIFPALALFVVSEFPASRGKWIAYRPGRSLNRNLARIRADLLDIEVKYSAVLLDPAMPYWSLRLLGLLFTRRVLVFNENLGHFALHPRSGVAILRHLKWRAISFARFQTHPGGDFYTFVWRLGKPEHLRRPWYYRLALRAGDLIASRKRVQSPGREELNTEALAEGISVVIPSRDGRELLARLLPGLVEELSGRVSEIIVIDNGSGDGTAGWLAESYSAVRIEVHRAPLSFAAAVNRGIALSRFAYVCTLNNDMVLRSGFFEPLREAFRRTPELFCATAQISFPDGERRQETGKAVMPSETGERDFPLRCDDPLAGESGTYVLYGSGGCSLFDVGKLRALGGFDETFQPAYVEDLDLGFRGWQRGWPTVFVAEAQVVHAHRSTTGRYWSEGQLETVVDTNYLRFLARTVADPDLFLRMWKRAVWRLNLLAAAHVPYEPAIAALQAAWRLRSEARNAASIWPEKRILAAGSGDLAVFPGSAPRHPTVILIASPYLPFPLSHGGAVRMYNLIQRAAIDDTIVLVCFVEEWSPPAAELLALCAEVVLVRRRGSHTFSETERPGVVEEFDSAAFGAALQLAVRKWKPTVAQLEFTQLAQYATDCVPSKTLLVEHDITYDLYEQMLARQDNWETRQQYERWIRFEQAAWKQVDRVVVMSERDRQTVGERAFCLPNGVDIVRFGPSEEAPQNRRILFLGSFGHLPNLLAIDFFLGEVWPLIQHLSPTLHVIAGSRHQFHLERYEGRERLRLDQSGIEVEGFVSDVRPAYRLAEVVIAPLRASAGTNIKVLEAMAMGKAIVSTAAGVNGLDVSPGVHYLLAETGAETASALESLFEQPDRRLELEGNARARAVEVYDWDRIGRLQRDLYRGLG